MLLRTIMQSVARKMSNSTITGNVEHAVADKSSSTAKIIKNPLFNKNKINITHVIFDVDGLLLDTEKLYTVASENVCQKYGKQFTWEVKKAQMGRREVQSAEVLLDMLKLPLTVQEYLDLSHAEHEKLFPEVQLMPGATELVTYFYNHGYPLAIATGSHSNSWKLKTLKHDGLLKMFQHAVVSGDDPEVKFGKPHPDVYEICMRRYKNPPAHPENVLVFEDALNGVLSAVAAKMHCIAVPDAREDLDTFHMADFIISTLADFNPEWYNMPPMDEHAASPATTKI